MILSPGVRSKPETGLSQAEVSACYWEELRNTVSAASSGQIRFKWPGGRSPGSTLGCPGVRDTYPGHSTILAQLLIGPKDCLTHALEAKPFFCPNSRSSAWGTEHRGPPNAGVRLGVSVSPWTRNLAGSAFHQSMLESTFGSNARGTVLLPSLSYGK